MIATLKTFAKQRKALRLLRDQQTSEVMYGARGQELDWQRLDIDGGYQYAGLGVAGGAGGTHEAAGYEPADLF